MSRGSRLAWLALSMWACLALLPASGAAWGQERDAEPPAIDVARVVKRQPLLLERALDGVQRAQPGQSPQLYFLAFAGWGSQAVFKREALAVREIFDARFGTKDRSLVLINHASTLDEVALASPRNLNLALRRLGTLMNKDEDVLFLFLTSHGLKGLLAVDIPGIGRRDLGPADLKAMLDRSGIKNRVIVISACHSGSFIPTLAGPTTLVIAAAHAERTSFGCEDQREWTYFGEAYFSLSLREERSFERAFKRARRTISFWERREGLQASLPQIAGGQALRQRLDGIARENDAH